MLHWFAIRQRPSVVRPTTRATTFPRARWPLYLGVILGIWVSFWLYADTLSLPYLQEDVTHLRWLASRDPLDPFLNAEGAPAYRPLGKSIIKIWYLILGHHDRPWLRFQNIALNALNISLVGLLGVWIDRSEQRFWNGGIAALLFGSLPFAYQAIPWINNFFYPLSLFLLLMMCAVYWQARLRQSNRLLILAFFLAFLSPFEIEYGVMGCGLLFAVEVALLLQGRQRQIWLGGPLLGLLMNAAFVVRWATVPKEAYSFGLPTPERVMQIGTYFLQGLVYPVSPLAVPLMDRTGWSDLVATLVVVIPITLLLLAYLAFKRRWSLLAMALIWFILLNLPALIFVNFDYVLNGPRLLYPPGAAIGWLWGAALAAFAIDRRPRAWQAGLAAAFLCLTLLVSAVFVRRLMHYYHMVEEPVYKLAEAAQGAPKENQLLIVNFPSWITPPQRTFALGNHGMQLVPFYIGLDAVVYGHNEAEHPVRAVQFANVRQANPYFYGMHGQMVDYDGLQHQLLQSGDVYLTQWHAQRIGLVPAGRVLPNVSSGTVTAVFDKAITVSLSGSHVGEEGIELTLEWQVHQAIEEDVTVFVHLYGPDGTLVSQADGYPLLGLAPFWLWEEGQALRDQRYLFWPPQLEPGVYRVGIGLYNPATGQRLPATDPAGNPLPDNSATLLIVTRDTS